MKISHVLLALSVILIWGLNFSVIKFGLDELPPILFSALRFTLVAIPACFFVPRPKVNFFYILAVGILLGIIKFSLLFIGIDIGLSPGLASLVLQIQVIFTIILSYLFLKETVNQFQAIGISFSLIGFIYITFSSGENLSLAGLILVMLAGFTWAISNVITKHMPAVNMFHFMVWISLIPPIPLFLISYFFESNEILNTFSQLSVKGFTSLLFTSFFSTLVAFSVWGKLLRLYPSASITPFALLIPIFGMSISSATFGEKFSQNEVLAIVLVMLGLVLSVMGKQMYEKIKGRKYLQNIAK